MRRLVALILVGVLAACGSSPVGGPGPDGSGPPADGGNVVADGGASDGGLIDGGASDGGTADAGAGDAGIPPDGGGLPDGGIAFDGGIILVDGGIVFPDGGIVLPDGGVIFPDGGIIDLDGGVGCMQIMQAYPPALIAAKQCDSGQPDQCTIAVPSIIGCGCTTYVNQPATTVQALLEAWQTLGCTRICPAQPCLVITGGECTAQGMCVDVTQ